MKIQKKLLSSLFLFFGIMVIISQTVANPPSSEEVEGYMRAVVQCHQNLETAQRHLKEELEPVNAFLSGHRYCRGNCGGQSPLCNSDSCLLSTNQMKKKELESQLTPIVNEIADYKDLADVMSGFQKNLHKLRWEQAGLRQLIRAHQPLVLDNQNCIVPGCNPHNYSYLRGRLPCQLFQHQQRAKKVEWQIADTIEQIRPYMSEWWTIK